jgi:hypothetical protein
MLIKKSRDAKQLDQIQWIHKAMISINNKGVSNAYVLKAAISWTLQGMV